MSTATVFKQHIDHVVQEVKTAYPSNGLEEDVIKQSWLRCVNTHSLNPERPEPARILPFNEVLEHKDKIDEFLHVARIGIESLYQHVSSLDYILLLTDSNGIAVDFIGDKKFDNELKKAGLYLGSDWNEAHAGTCGVGTCITNKKPLTCHQTDHFHATHISLTCTSAPIFDPYGSLLAVLDVSALRSAEPKEGQFLIGQLTIKYAKHIESANFFRHFHHHRIIKFSNTLEFIDIASDNLLAIDDSGIIVGATQSAATALNPILLVKELIGRYITDFFECSTDNLVSHLGTTDTSHTGMLITRENNKLYYATIIEPRNIKTKTTSKAINPSKNYHALEKLAQNDPLMDKTINRAKRLLNQSVNIIIGGETGTGKEVMARALHECSDRFKQPFVAVNCAAIPESLIESELFGYKSGSFTGARSKGMQGLIMQSNNGTLFLDEIGDMPLQLQSRLLRVLAEKEVMAIGATKPEPINLHVISASHRDIRVLIAEGTFREDLYYRLNGAIINLPSLRDRSDKMFIILTILKEESRLRNMSVSLSKSAQKILFDYSWPGNIRQLRNAIQFSLAVCDNHIITDKDLPDELFDSSQIISPQTITSDNTLIQQQGHYSHKHSQLISMLKLHRWNITAVSQELGVSRSTIYRRMERYGIIPPHLA